MTETAIVNYHTSSGDTQLPDIQYGDWLNRLNTQFGFRNFTGGIRLDSALYVDPPSPEYLGKRQYQQQPFAVNCPGANQTSPRDVADCYNGLVDGFRPALLNRYRSTIYPSKLFAAYKTADLELTAGDFYAQFGRGLVLSIRKVDELAIDTTIRGLKADYTFTKNDFKFGTTLLAGYGNPVRVDEASGRSLVAPSSPFFAGMPRPDSDSRVTNERAPTLRPDAIAGVKFEGGTRAVTFGAQASVIGRGGFDEFGTLGTHAPSQDVLGTAMPSSKARTIETGSLSASVPNIANVASFYVEGAVQERDGLGQSSDPNGHALYASLSLDKKPVTALVELRHTRRFYPLTANTNSPEFLLLSYNTIPTTGPVTIDSEFGNFATCTTGGRARVDVRLSPYWILYGSVGHYATWAERLGDCDADGSGLKDSARNNIWDPYIGITATYDHNRSRWNVWSGTRIDESAEPLFENGTSLYYREAYVRYDALHGISPTWAVQLQGAHRMRTKSETHSEPWREGEHYTGVQWASKVTASFGYEYSTAGGELQNFWNGSILWRFTRSSSLRLFGGQQRGALRCMNGVCRVFPPFEGAKAEFVIRY